MGYRIEYLNERKECIEDNMNDCMEAVKETMKGSAQRVMLFSMHCLLQCELDKIKQQIYDAKFVETLKAEKKYPFDKEQNGNAS